MPRAVACTLVLLGALAACAPTALPPPKPVPLATTLERSAPDVRADIVATLRQLGLEPRSDSGLIEVRGSGNDFLEYFDCARITLYDPYSEDNAGRFRFVEAHGYELEAEIRAEPASGEGTDLHVRADYHGIYRNSFTNLDVRHRCGGTGAFERQILETARGS